MTKDHIFFPNSLLIEATDWSQEGIWNVCILIITDWNLLSKIWKDEQENMASGLWPIIKRENWKNLHVGES